MQRIRLLTAVVALTALAAAGLATAAQDRGRDKTQGKEHGGHRLTATLTGAAEVPGPGDADGAGRFTATLNQGQNQVCFELTVSNIAPATAAHIHRGAAGEAGPPVVTLEPLSTSGTSKGCVSAAADLVQEIRQSPENFYVNVHNAEFPDGAVRGQLSQGAQEKGAGQERGGRSLKASLTGAAEVPGPGDADGRGTATFKLNQGQNQVCFELRVSNIAPATAAHIHRGAAGAAGPPVVTLEPLSTSGRSKGCVSATAEVIQEIRQSPAGFYVNVHNAEFPDGAVRGQLSR